MSNILVAQGRGDYLAARSRGPEVQGSEVQGSLSGFVMNLLCDLGQVTALAFLWPPSCQTSLLHTFKYYTSATFK